MREEFVEEFTRDMVAFCEVVSDCTGTSLEELRGRVTSSEGEVGRDGFVRHERKSRRNYQGETKHQLKGPELHTSENRSLVSAAVGVLLVLACTVRVVDKVRNELSEVEAWRLYRWERSESIYTASLSWARGILTGPNRVQRVA